MCVWGVEAMRVRCLFSTTLVEMVDCLMDFMVCPFLVFVRLLSFSILWVGGGEKSGWKKGRILPGGSILVSWYNLLVLPIGRI